MVDFITLKFPISTRFSGIFLQAMKKLFEKKDKEGKISIYFSKGRIKDTDIINVRISANDMRKTQIISLPIMQYLNFLELGLNLAKKNKLINFTLEKKEDDLYLKIGGQSFSYKQIFYPRK